MTWTVDMVLAVFFITGGLLALIYAAYVSWIRK